MKKKDINKKYIYFRDNQKCYHCGKEISLSKCTLDHYYPRSRGGTYDLFNLVCSCKKCNSNKKSMILADYEELWIELFKKGISDRKIFPKSNSISNADLVNIVEHVEKAYIDGKYMIFETQDFRIYVEENRIIKIILISKRDKKEMRFT